MKHAGHYQIYCCGGDVACHPGKPKPFVPLTIVADPDHESGFIVIMGNQQIVGKIKASQTAKLMEISGTISLAECKTPASNPANRNLYVTHELSRAPALQKAKTP